MGSEDNGSGGDRPNGVYKLTITMEKHTLKPTLDLDTESLDIALMMLQRAYRELETRFRFVRARELLAESMQQEATNRLVQNAMRDPRIKV